LPGAGDKKISSDPFSVQSAEQKAVQEEIMGSLHDSFISFVKERRGAALVDPEQKDVFSGRVWTGCDAVKVGLVDHVGTLDEV
jgi:protease IV